MIFSKNEVNQWMTKVKFNNQMKGWETVGNYLIGYNINDSNLGLLIWLLHSLKFYKARIYVEISGPSKLKDVSFNSFS